MVSPNRRTWTLTELERGPDYRLWFCERERRWEVQVLGAWLPPSAAPWPEDQDEPEPEPPDQRPRSRPDGPQRSEDRPPAISDMDRWPVLRARPSWLPPL
jgi:hypothetical protein